MHKDTSSAFIKNLKLLFVIVLIFIDNTYATSSFNLYDGFETGISNIWKVDGRWNISSNGEQFDGRQSVKSEIYGQQIANLSNKIEFYGPCNISFNWKLSRGYNKLILCDNNILTGYILPDYEFNHYMHDEINWTKIDYNISDYSRHELTWVHYNPFGYGAAWIDSMNVTYHIPPRFENLDVMPKEAILIRNTSNNNENIFIKQIAFNYSVDSSSNDVVLYIRTNHSSPNEAPLTYYPTKIIQNISKGLYEFKWDNIKLEIDNIDNVTYWFAAENYNSTEKIGPSISLFVDDSDVIRTNESGDCTIEDYYITLKGRKTARITLWLKNESNVWSPYKDTKIFSPSDTIKSIWWNDTIWCRENHPEEWHFRIEW